MFGYYYIIPVFSFPSISVLAIELVDKPFLVVFYIYLA